MGIKKIGPFVLYLKLLLNTVIFQARKFCQTQFNQYNRWLKLSPD
jgi:hypothetical protein